MFDWLYHLLLGLTIILAVLDIYFALCFIAIFKLTEANMNKISGVAGREALKYASNLNIFVYWLSKSKKIQEGAQKSAEKEIRKKVKTAKSTCVLIVVTLTIMALISGSLASAVYSFNNTVTGWLATYLITIADEDAGCICYAKCTGDEDDDSKSTYELLFGPKNYKTFLATFDDYIQAEANNAKTGSEINAILLQNLNDNSVQAYKEVVTSARGFRSMDGEDRTTMSIDELKYDLQALLKDYKEHGVNPDCEVCNNKNKVELEVECIGEKHYKANVEFSNTWVDPGNNNNTGTNNTTTTGTPLGSATGNYAKTMQDGLSYYWYHQMGNGGDGCVYCGNWSAMKWGEEGNWHYFGRDGCAIYALAMVVSNLTGQAVTPIDLLVALGCTMETKSDGILYCNTRTSTAYQSTSPRIISRSTAIDIVANTYNLRTEPISNDEASWNNVLDQGGMIWERFVPHGPADFYWYGGDGHFMAIRKRDASTGEYYCLTSCGSTVAGVKHDKFIIMNTPQSPSVVLRNVDGQAFGLYPNIINPTPDPSNPGGTNNPGSNINSGTPTGTSGGYTTADISRDIANGLYTQEDYDYLVAIGGESKSYEGFYAVASSVRNRVNAYGRSYKSIVSQQSTDSEGKIHKQYSAYNTSRIGNPENADINRAAIDILRGAPSSVGGCRDFFGRINGYDMWADAGVEEFYNVGGNIFYNNLGDGMRVHNKAPNIPADAIMIYDNASKTWIYNSGEGYHQ